MLEDAAGEGGVSFLRNQLRWVVLGEFLQKEEIGGGDGVAQQLDALADERGDGEKLFWRGLEPGLLEEGLEAEAQLVDGECADVLGVQPDGFGIERVVVCEIDDGVGAVDALEGEGGGEIVEREELAVVLGHQPRRQRKLMKAWGRKPASR